jgi:hypothetical protein
MKEMGQPTKQILIFLVLHCRYRFRSDIRLAGMTNMIYDCYIGRPGHWSESELFATLVSHPLFSLMPGEDREATAKITDFFFLNRDGQHCSIEDVVDENKQVFLHGCTLDWSGELKLFTVGNIRIDQWYVCNL